MTGMPFTPYIIIDIAILAALAVFVARGVKKGFVLSLCGLLAVVVAFTGSVILANALSPKVGELLEPRFVEFVDTHVKDFLKDPGAALPDGATLPDGTAVPDGTALPDGMELKDLPLDDLLAFLRETDGFQALADVVEGLIKDGAATGANALESIAANLAHSVAYAVVFIVSFLLLSLAWTLLSHALDLVSRLPVLNSLNKLGGAAVGLAKGCIILFVAAWLVRFIDGLVPAEAIEQTYLLKFFMTTNPVTLITGV